jgi:hypothetical protein
LLEYHAAIRPGPSDLDTISEDLSTGGADITGYAIEQGRLAAARRPEETDEGTGLDIERGALDGVGDPRSAAEGDGKIVESDHAAPLVA